MPIFLKQLVFLTLIRTAGVVYDFQYFEDV